MATIFGLAGYTLISASISGDTNGTVSNGTPDTIIILVGISSNLGGNNFTPQVLMPGQSGGWANNPFGSFWLIMNFAKQDTNNL